MLESFLSAPSTPQSPHFFAISISNPSFLCLLPYSLSLSYLILFLLFMWYVGFCITYLVGHILIYIISIEFCVILLGLYNRSIKEEETFLLIFDCCLWGNYFTNAWLLFVYIKLLIWYIFIFCFNMIL